MYDAETRSKAVELIESGATIASVAERLGVSASSVSEWKARGHAERKTDRRSPDEIAALRARVFELYTSGVPQSEISGQVNVSRSQVYRWVADAKLQGTLKEPVTVPPSKPTKPSKAASKPTARAAPLEAHAPAEVMPTASVPPEPQHTVGELLIAARARVGVARAPSPEPAPDYRHTLEVAELRGRIEALTIERDALRKVIDRMHAQRDT